MKTGNQYPDHLSDSIRREIAVSYLRHEIRKLFPSLGTNKEFEGIDKDIACWFSENPTLAPIHDFWNGVHAISMGFRLKNIVTWLTSKNILWKKEKLPLVEIKFGATFEELEAVGHFPTIEQVRMWYFAPQNIKALQDARKAHERRSSETAPRDKFPILVRQMGKDRTVIDGNRRLLKAVLEEHDSIEAFVGTVTGDPLFLDHWVPTSSLLELVSAHRYWVQQKRETTVAVASVVSESIRDSSVGQRQFLDRCLDTDHHETDTALLNAVNKLLSL